MLSNFPLYSPFLQIELPEGYYFGISASSAENPDSFEVHKFIVSTKASQEPPNPNKQDYVNSQHQQQKIAAQKGHEEQTHKQNQAQQKYGSSISQNDIPKMVEDVLAGNIQSQQDQFADLHNRIQIINNRVAEMAETIELIHKENSERWNELMHRIVPIDDRGAATIRNVEKVERTTSQILRDLESKDFKDMMNQFHRAMEKSTQGVIRSMPEIVGSGKFEPSEETDRGSGEKKTDNANRRISCYHQWTQYDNLFVHCRCGSNHSYGRVYSVQEEEGWGAQEVLVKTSSSFVCYMISLFCTGSASYYDEMLVYAHGNCTEFAE